MGLIEYPIQNDNHLKPDAPFSGGRLQPIHVRIIRSRRTRTFTIYALKLTTNCYFER